MSAPPQPQAADHPAPEIAEPSAKKAKLDDDAASSPPLYTLHGYWRSGASWRVRIALAMKGLPFTHAHVNLLKSEQTSDAYAKMNPQRKVPLLVIGGDAKKSISQSLAIIDFLDQQHPDTYSMLPKDLFLRAKAWSLAEGVNADIQPLQNLPTLGRVGQLLGEQAKTEWAVFFISKGLKAFEENVAEVGGKYCLGDEITIVDACLVPQLSAARRFPIDLSAYPNLLRIEKELSTHPAFIAAHANAQPDKPEGPPIE